MSKTTLITQQVQLQKWFQMMQESKGRLFVISQNVHDMILLAGSSAFIRF